MRTDIVNLVRRVRLAVPAALVRLLPAARRAKHFRARLQAGRYAGLHRVRGRSDPFSDGDALFWAVDHLLHRGEGERLPDLVHLARQGSPFAARLWRALCLWHSGAEVQSTAALERHFNDASQSGYARRAARAWALYLSLPSFEPAAPEHDTPSPRLMQFWDTDPPADVVAEMQAWERLAGARYVRFDAERAIEFFHRAIGAAEARMLAECPHPAIQSDFFRLGWLMTEGGIYVDADARMRPGFADLYQKLGGRTVLWFRTRAAEMTVINGFIAAPAGSAFVEGAFKIACRRLASGKDMHVFDYAGPTLMTQAALRLAERGKLGPVATLTDGFVAANIMGQIDSSYKRDTRNWRLWAAERRP